MSFRIKLLLSMVVLVVGITATALLITGNQVRQSYERHFQQSFQFQMGSFLRQRAARLEPVRERVSATAASPRLLAPMEIAGQEHAEQRDIDDLYQNGSDQLSDIIASISGGGTNRARGFFLFLNNRGQILYPSAQVKLPFVLPSLGRIGRQIETLGASIHRDSEPVVGYLGFEESPATGGVREMVFAPIVDQVAHQKLGVLGVGFPVPAADSLDPMLSALWVDNRLYSSSIPPESLKHVELTVGERLRAGGTVPPKFTVQLGDVPYQAYCQVLSTGSGFPPAYQVYLYSLADAMSENQRFARRLLVSGTIASIFALVVSWLISRSLAVPLQELVAGTSQIERGNFDAKVPVRGRDELSKLGQAFNAMAQRIQSTYAALEEKIAERTHELEERKRAEAALRKSEASLRDAQRIAHLGNWEWNISSNQLRWSDEIYSIFGLTETQFEGTHESFLERVHPADRARVEEAVRESLDKGKTYGLEHRVVRPTGEIRIVREQAELFRDEAGQPTRMVGTVQDVTEQKKIEAEFLRAQRMDSIGAIAGGMAHDLNNALAPILMGIQLIRKKVAEPDVRQMLSVMETNTHRGADMVRQVLTFARGHDGEKELLEVGRLVREMESILRQTMPKTISVQCLIPNDLWPVLGNATQLHQALLNLCVNARDAMPKGGKLILAADNVELTEEEAKEISNAQPGSFVTILVSDTGTGIPPEILPKIFDAFYTTKEPGKGTGLGLSTIVRIVRNHGGFISLRSEVGTGTTFELYLPRAEAAPVAAPTMAEGPPTIQRGRGELLLFVDDDRSVREMVTPSLTEQGYRILTAANGAEALAILDQHGSDVRLVVTDVAMPLMSGLELTEKLQARRPGLPIVLMSGTYEAERAPSVAGVAGFLTKPFRLEQLLATIGQVLDQSPS